MQCYPYFAEGDTRIFWLRLLKGEKVTIMDERTLCVSDSSALCLPEGVDTQLSVSLTRSISEEWRTTPSCTRCGLVEVQCQCRKDDRHLTLDNPLESPSRVQFPFTGPGTPPIDQSSLAGDLDNPSNLDEQAGDSSDKWWSYLSRPTKGIDDSFSIGITVDTLSAALDQVSRKQTTSELRNYPSALPKQVVPNASTNLSTNADPSLTKQESMWTTIHDIMSDLVDASTELRRDPTGVDSDYESSDDSLNMSETLSDISVKLMNAQKIRKLKKSSQARIRNSGYMSSLFGSDTSISTSGDESDDSATASMPPSSPASPDESVQWTDDDGASNKQDIKHTVRVELEGSHDSLTETRINPLSPTFHRKLLESLETLAESRANVEESTKKENTVVKKIISPENCRNVERDYAIQLNGALAKDKNPKKQSENKENVVPKKREKSLGDKLMPDRKILNQILTSPTISPQPQAIQVYHVTTSPTQSPKSPASNESNETPAQPASPSGSPPQPTSPTDTTGNGAVPSSSLNPDATGQASVNSSQTSTPFEGAGDSKGKISENPTESRKEERKHGEKKETEEERRRRKEKEKKKKKKHKHDRDRDHKSSSDKHDRSKDREKERDKSKDKDRDRQKDRERRRKEEREREHGKKDHRSSSSSKHGSRSASRESIRQLGNILSKMPVEVSTGKESAAGKEEKKEEEEIVLDLGDNFIVEDAKLAFDKNVAQIVASAPTRRVVNVITIDSSEDEKDKLSKPDKPVTEKFKTEKEIKKEPMEKPSKLSENVDGNIKVAENNVVVKKEPKEAPAVAIKKEDDDLSNALKKLDEELFAPEGIKKENCPKAESAESKKGGGLVWISADTGDAKNSTEKEPSKESNGTSEMPGAERQEPKKESDGTSKDPENKEKKDKRYYKFKIKTKGDTLRSPIHADGLLRKFKVKISRRERKRANKAGKNNYITYNDEIRRDVISRRTKFSRSSVPSHPIKVEKKEQKKERRAVILDDSDEETAPPVKKEPEVRDHKSILEKLAQETFVKKEKKEEERPKPSEQSSAHKMLIEKLKREQQERMKEKARALAMASSNSSSASSSSKVDDFLVRRMFKRNRKKYGLKMCSVGISYKEKRRADKKLQRLKGTLYLLKMMREGKLARERERAMGHGFKRPAEPEHTSQPKRFKSGDSSAAWRSMPSFKIPKAGQESDGFKVPRARDQFEDRGRMSEDKENEDLGEEFEEGFFTEEELKAKERGNVEKKKEKDEKANLEELKRKGQELRKEWKRRIRRKVTKTGAIIFEVIYQSVGQLFHVVATTLTYLHEH